MNSNYATDEPGEAALSFRLALIVAIFVTMNVSSKISYMKNALLLLSAFAVLVCVTLSSCGVDSNAATHDIESVAPSTGDTVSTVKFGQPSVIVAPDVPNAEYIITDGESVKPSLDSDVCCDLMPIEYTSPGLTPENSQCSYKRHTYCADLPNLGYPPSSQSSTHPTAGHGTAPIYSNRWQHYQMQFNDNCTVDHSLC